VRGVAVERDDWDALTRLGRRRVRVRARLETLRQGGVVSHRSAAALWGFPDLDPDDGRLHVVDPTRSTTHTGPGVVRHAARLGEDEVLVHDGVAMTSARRTVLDVLRTSSFEHGVVVLDHALRRELVARDDLRAALEPLTGRRGVARALRVVAFADHRSESPGESLSRVRARDLRAPRPDLQQEFTTDRGQFRVDFWWPEHGVVGEFDGRVKYGTKDPEALWREKLREDAVRRVADVRTVARWTYSDVIHPQRLAMILAAAGLPLGRRNTAHPTRHRR
jgi:hypothetical protein